MTLTACLVCAVSRGDVRAGLTGVGAEVVSYLCGCWLRPVGGVAMCDRRYHAASWSGGADLFAGGRSNACGHAVIGSILRGFPATIRHVANATC